MKSEEDLWTPIMPLTDETAKELAAAMLKLAEAINALNSKSNGLGGFTVYHQHTHSQPTHPCRPRGSGGY